MYSRFVYIYICSWRKRKLIQLTESGPLFYDCVSVFIPYHFLFFGDSCHCAPVLTEEKAYYFDWDAMREFPILNVIDFLVSTSININRTDNLVEINNNF